VGEWVAGRERGQRQRRANGLFEMARVAQGANKPVVRRDVRRVGRDGGTKCLGRCGRRAGSEQVEATLAERFGGGLVGCGHGYL